MDQVILFDKSLQQRLEEYKDVLSGYEVLSVSMIKKEWSFYLDLTLDPNGWQAVWKIQRQTCEVLNIPFPSVVLVYVINISTEDLSALVKILAVQDDIHLPEKQQVPLLHLWPTKEQDKSVALNLQSTANALDMLRFFYANILMPWDYDEDTVDWASNHLESRLRLYYDMKNGVMPRSTAEHLHCLISEAKRLQIKQENIQSELSECDDLDVDNVNNVHVQALMETHIRMMEIKAEVDIFENPLLRNAVIKKMKEKTPNKSETVQNIWVIYEQGTADDCMSFLSEVKKEYPEKILKFSSYLYETLGNANPNDIYILSESSHVIKTTGALEQGGKLKGIAHRDNTVLKSTVDNVMLDIRGDHVILENLTIDASSAQCAIIVRRGHLLLKNCKLIGDGKSSTHQGIIVLAGAQVELIDSEVSSFCTAVVGNSGSSITLKDTEICNVNYGLKVYDNCTVQAVKAVIRDCRNYGICVETENTLDLNAPMIGSFDCLNV